MSFFGRKNKSSANNDGPEPPPRLSEADLADASRLMDRWDGSMGNSDAVWESLEAIARRGGFRGGEATLMEVVGGKDAGDVTQRPWRWWNEAARLASASGDHMLAGRIFLFAYLFVNQMVPKMSAGDMMQTGLDRPKTASTLVSPRLRSRRLLASPSISCFMTPGPAKSMSAARSAWPKRWQVPRVRRVAYMDERVGREDDS